jgi:hypothetical protein
VEKSLECPLVISTEVEKSLEWQKLFCYTDSSASVGMTICHTDSSTFFRLRSRQALEMTSGYSRDFSTLQQIDIAFEANKTQPPPAPSKGGYPPLEGEGGGEICKLQHTISPL